MAGRRTTKTKMAREKIKIRKIESITARQVTFSKRRRGIFKKAQELAVLCDADLALVIFSATAKLFHYSNSRMKDILERYIMHSKRQEQPPFLELQPEDNNLARLRKEAADKRQELGKLKGEELHGLDLEELHQLEKMLEGSLSRVVDAKEKRLTTEIEALKEKGAKLMEENARLKQRLAMLYIGTIPINNVDQPDTIITNEEGQSSESFTNEGPPLTDQCDSSDTSLKLV